MLKTKTNIIIQCRFASTRLPGKAMYPLCSIPLLAFLIRRMKNGLPENRYRIIVATTKNREDNPVAAWAEHEKVYLIRGTENDVLSRYIQTISQYHADTNVRVTADNPLTCPEILKTAVSLLQKKQLDYVQTKNFPYGTGVDVFSAPLLNHLDKQTAEPLDREHINNYVLNHPDKFRLETIQAKGTLARPDLNMTIDAIEDFDRVSMIFNRNNDSLPWNLPLEEAIQRLTDIN